MKKTTVCIVLLLVCTQWAAQSQNWVDLINPLMGTGSTYEFSHGNTYPAVAVPWGMNFWTPQTGENRNGWMYTYDQKQIRGFRQTHQPSPWINDYGTFSIMPISGTLRIGDKQRGALFSHDNETATPYYYQVKFDNGVTTRISATHRGAILSIVFPSGADQYVVIDGYDGGSSLSIDREGGHIVGQSRNNHGGVPDNFSNYYYLSCDKEIVDYGATLNGELTANKSYAAGEHVCGYLKFNIPAGDTLHIRVASSFISSAQAELNYNREVAGRSQQDIELQGRTMWNEQLGRIQVEGGSAEQRSVFYSCLYRTLLFPREFFEYDPSGNPIYYSPYDGKIHQGYMYTDNGFWDTFRAVHPLFTLVYPEVSERVMQSLVAAYQQSGFLPEWASPGHRGCMIGNNSLSLISDAWIKGIRNFDVQTALKAMVHQTVAQGDIASVGRNGFEQYHTLGYVAYPSYPEATAKTLEYAYSDWCLARLASELDSTELAQDYYAKSQNYKNVFDPTVGFMRGRDAQGKWMTPFYPEEWGGPFTEGSSWHYSWSVMHDVAGLASLMGGTDKMASRLDSMFIAKPEYKVGTYGFVIHEIAEMVALNMGQYAHGNQPVQHAIYLYNYLGQPWKTQYHIRQVLDKLYNSGAQGYCGDEDNGQTSAWYVFSAMGLYPVCPGQPEYVLGSPLFNKVTLSLPHGKSFVIQADNNSPQNYYIQQAELNKTRLTRNYLTHEDVVNGGVFRLKMGAKPNTQRGINSTDFPYSLSTHK